MADLRTAAEIAYDNLKTGAAYVKPEQDEAARMRQWREQARITGSPELRSVLDWIDAHFAAEQRADDDYTPLSPAWEAVLDITSEPTNDGRAHEDDEPVCFICGAAEDCDCDDSTEKERQPVPPVPAGYSCDRAFIYQSYGETFISIDRRDGELLICNKCEKAGDEDAVILTPARAMALYRFFRNDDMVELMQYHRKNAAA